MCGPFGFVWRIQLPMARPALATVSVLAMVPGLAFRAVAERQLVGGLAFFGATKG